VAKQAREFRYAIGLDRAGRITADGRSPLDLDVDWTPEHLLLAALTRCTLQSLRFHAARAGLDFLASASASGIVTKPQQDGRYAFVEIDVARLFRRRLARTTAALPLAYQRQRPLGSFERRHRQPVAAQLFPVELGRLAVSRPDDRASRVVDSVGDL